MQTLINKIKKVSLTDILGIIKFVLVLLPALIKKIYLKLSHKKLWLICENKNTAHDNGYIFYKYMKENHSEISCYYAINKKSKAYDKIKQYETIINWGSLKHYYYYMSCTKNISSHKEGNPNHTLFTILHLYLKLYNNRVFLQHGVLYQNLTMFHKKNTNFKLFITGAMPEYNFVKEKYGYTDEVKYTGLARFDNLHDNKPDSKIILLIPTWRRWLTTKEKFENSTYFKGLNNLINCKEIEELLEKYDKYIYFYPHISTQKFLNCYDNKNQRVKILNYENTNIQDLLKKGALLITDFSSIHTDFAYMHKPIIYYQYDSEEFYNKHIINQKSESYYDFKKMGFGKVTEDEESLLKELEIYIKNDFKEQDIYKERINKFFILHDNHNCDRIYKEIIEVE